MFSKLLPSSSLHQLLFHSALGRNNCSYHFFYSINWPLTSPIRALPPQRLCFWHFSLRSGTPSFTSVCEETLDWSSWHPPIKVQFSNLPAVSQRTAAKWVNFWSSCQHFNVRPWEDVLRIAANQQGKLNRYWQYLFSKYIKLCVCSLSHQSKAVSIYFKQKRPKWLKH